MTALQLNAELYRNLGIIAEDEVMLKKVANYVKRLVNKMSATDQSLLTEDEFYARLDKAEREIEEGKCVEFTDATTMNQWLNNL